MIPLHGIVIDFVFVKALTITFQFTLLCLYYNINLTSVGTALIGTLYLQFCNGGKHTIVFRFL